MKRNRLISLRGLRSASRSMRPWESELRAKDWRAGGFPGSHGPDGEDYALRVKRSSAAVRNLARRSERRLRQWLRRTRSIRRLEASKPTLNLWSLPSVFWSMRPWESEPRAKDWPADGLSGSQGPGDDIYAPQVNRWLTLERKLAPRFERCAWRGLKPRSGQDGQSQLRPNVSLCRVTSASRSMGSRGVRVSPQTPVGGRIARVGWTEVRRIWT